MPLILAGIVLLAIPASAAGWVSAAEGTSRRSRGALFAALLQLFFLCLHAALFVPELLAQYAVFGLVVWVPLALLAGLLVAGRAGSVIGRWARAS